MRVAEWILAIGCLSGIAVCQHIHDLIPEVEQCVDSMLNNFDSWVNNRGPHPGPPPRPSTTKSISPTATASCSYWLENIEHRGISAFNPDPNYVVFRNVKDYGAKGKPNPLLCNIDSHSLYRIGS